MMGFLALFLPSFRLDRCGIAMDGSQPAVLVAVSQGGERVLTASPAAEVQRVRVGMTLAEARGFCPTVKVERLDVDAELPSLEENRLHHRGGQTVLVLNDFQGKEVESV